MEISYSVNLSVKVDFVKAMISGKLVGTGRQYFAKLVHNTDNRQYNQNLTIKLISPCQYHTKYQIHEFEKMKANRQRYAIFSYNYINEVSKTNIQYHAHNNNQET